MKRPDLRRITLSIFPALLLIFGFPNIDVAVAGRAICVTCDTTQTIVSRFPPPDGYVRVPLADDSFGTWIRGLLLQPAGSVARDWRGDVALAADEVAAVFDWRLLGAVEQCADISLRMISEFARKQNQANRIRFRSLSGDDIAWTNWLTGRYGINATQTRITYSDGGSHPDSRAEFDRYLKFVMNYTNTASMVRDWPEASETSPAIGDVIIQPFRANDGGGHLSVVVDACIDDDGRQLFLFADGYTPARIPVIRQRIPGQPSSAWMTPEQYLDFQRQFGAGTFHRFAMSQQ